MALVRQTPQPYGKLTTERLGTRTRKDLHVLCYQHHTVMLPELLHDPSEQLLYVCKEPGCLIGYNNLDGYFIHTENAKTVKEELTPRVSCSNDERLMYLTEVRPDTRSFRLWKCPECGASRTNEDPWPELGRKMGA